VSLKTTTQTSPGEGTNGPATGRLTRLFLGTATYLSLAAILAGDAAAKPSHADDTWVKDGRTNDNVASVFLNKAFSKKTGTFKSMPESMLEAEGTVSGEFLVGTYRFSYDTPISEGPIQFDELISVELLDCRRSYFGTLKQTRKLKGQVVAEAATPDAEILMMQVTAPSVDRKLCELRRRR
jgi:hypothetical protein